MELEEPHNILLERTRKKQRAAQQNVKRNAMVGINCMARLLKIFSSKAARSSDVEVDAYGPAW
jgi:hypothetical protein